MKITIELRNCTNAHVIKNIEAQQRAIDGKSLPNDFVLLIDTKSILNGIQEFLIKGGYHE